MPIRVSAFDAPDQISPLPSRGSLFKQYFGLSQIAFDTFPVPILNCAY